MTQLPLGQIRPAAQPVSAFFNRVKQMLLQRQLNLKCLAYRKFPRFNNVVASMFRDITRFSS